MSFEQYATTIADKAEARAAALAAMQPLYEAARKRILEDLKSDGLVEAIRRFEMRKIAIDRAINETVEL
jgi:hypothetical protein